MTPQEILRLAKLISRAVYESLDTDQDFITRCMAKVLLDEGYQWDSLSPQERLDIFNQVELEMK